MLIRFIFLLLLVISPFSNVSAQYTEIINANKPGLSQGAFAVGNKVLQVESGFSYGKEKHNLLNTDTDAYTLDYGVRYGFWKERLEVSLMGEFQWSAIQNNCSAIPIKTNVSNFKSNTLGAKYLIYDPYRKKELKGPNLYSWRANNKFQWNDLIPAIALYVGANFDVVDDNTYNPYIPQQESTISPKFVLATQNNWIGGWVFVTNIIVDRVTTDFPTYSYIVTLTHATNDYFSIFIENQGIKSDFYSDQLLRAGAASLINKNLQVDLSLTMNFKDTPSRYFARIGMAYRFDMHSDDEYLEDKQIRQEKKKEKKKEKKSKKKERFDELGKDGFAD